MFHDEDEEDFNSLPVKPRGKPNVSANIPSDDVPFDELPIVRRGGGGGGPVIPTDDLFADLQVKPIVRRGGGGGGPVIPTDDPFADLQVKPIVRRGGGGGGPVIPTDDPFADIQVKPRGGGSGVVNIPDEDPFDNVNMPTSESNNDIGLDDSDDFNNIPVKPRAVKAADVISSQETEENDKFEIHARTDNLEISDDIDVNLPVKRRSPVGAVVPDAVTTEKDQTAKSKSKGVTFDLNLNNTEELAQKVQAISLNDSDSGVGSHNSSAVGANSQELGDEFDGEFNTGSADFMNELSFLENCGDNDTEAALRQAELARKSLYVRFDPLVSDSSISNSPKQLQVDNLNFDELENTKCAKDDEATPKQTNSPNRSFVEVTDDPFSPAKTSLKESTMIVDQQIDTSKVSRIEDKGLVEPLLYTQSDLDEVVQAREDEWNKRYADLKAKITEEIAMRELLEQDHREKMECLRKENIDMKQVVSQYEKTIVELTENSHSSHVVNEETLSETVRAKEQLQQELHSAETNLVDAYKRIEKLKMAIDTYKSNEDDLKASVNEFQIKLKRSEERYQKLKQHAGEKVESANIEINKVRKQKEIDLAGLQASLKKAQSKINSLEQEVQQKIRENADYAQICDDLIKKVSGE